MDKFACPPHSSVGEGAIQCICDPGFKGPDHDSCEVCAAGSFCMGGNAEQQCPANAGSPAGAASADQCGCSKEFFELSRTNPANGPDCAVCSADHYCLVTPKSYMHPEPSTLNLNHTAPTLALNSTPFIPHPTP